MTIKVHTPRSVARDIGIINMLRNNSNTKGVYATVDGEDYAQYVRLYEEWNKHCDNPVAMEENCIGENKYELEFSFWPTGNAIELLRLYLKETAQWKLVVTDKANGNLKIIIEG
ncbi:hypothetical protein PHABIO_313 [Pseudomonas phage Phabio]|uniref:Uncharacterized protein n=1 Tax=Pseudomonas phage Phabio TaxID=2006668 RepID=A0A1Y0SWI4_9CAUD|nr:hypothetical protein MZD05_gp313 [Pseudomonas phage Phabio]ARV76944.1 hypothetical protein PHABIO_313 [Pseudomonas phage Phabio]